MPRASKNQSGTGKGILTRIRRAQRAYSRRFAPHPTLMNSDMGAFFRQSASDRLGTRRPAACQHQSNRGHLTRDNTERRYIDYKFYISLDRWLFAPPAAGPT